MGRLCGAQGGEPAALRLTRSGIRLLQQIDDSRATEWDLDRGYTGAYAVQCWPAQTCKGATCNILQDVATTLFRTLASTELQT